MTAAKMFRWTGGPGVSRRTALAMLGSSGLLMAGCGSSSSSAEDDSTDEQSDQQACLVVPGESAGAYPADGSDSANVLANAAVFRHDIRSDFGGDNTQDGVPLQLDLTLLDADGCAPLVGAAVYVWHCNAAGAYSAYAGLHQADHRSASFLRGVQISDGDGRLSFATIYPGRHAGRATHIYARVYRDDSLNQVLLTTQLALDEDTSEAVYASRVSYEDSAATPATDHTQDEAFGDGDQAQRLSLADDGAGGYVGRLSAALSVL